MANQESKVYNAYETTLAAGMTALATSLQVVAAGAVTPLTYLVVDPDDPAKREVMMVGAVAGTTFSSLSRYLSGSAAGSGLIHDSGAVVRSVAVQQMWEDVHDRIDQYSSHANLTNLAAGDPHTQYVAKTLVDAKGDIIAATAADAMARLPVGANGTMLQADSAQSTGLAYVASAIPAASAVADTTLIGTVLTWARSDHRHAREGFGNPAASAPADTMSAGAATTVARSDHRHAREAAATVTAIGVMVRSAAGTDPGIGVETNVAFATEVFDTDGFHDNVTNNSRLTVPSGLGGKYLVSFSIFLGAGTTNSSRDMGIRKNGAGSILTNHGGHLGNTQLSGGSVAQSPITASGMMSLVAGDYIEVRWAYNAGTGPAVFGWGADHFSMMRLGA